MKKLIIILAAFVAGCAGGEIKYDASGTFEAVETIVSAEANGIIKRFTIEEGQELKANQVVGYVDSVQLYLKKKQLEAQIAAVLSKKPNIATQIASLQEQLRQAQREQTRVENLLKADAATQKQLDDATAQVEIIKKQIAAQESSLGITSKSINEESGPLTVQIAQLEDQLSKCKIVNEVNGTVLTKYAEVNEMTATGKPLYKIADLSEIILRAYVTGDQLPDLKLGQHVTVLIDAPENSYKEYPGEIQWISSKAEFTPKTIQTKDERANLVYAVKIRVKNDGLIKIGMYGEVKLTAGSAN
ncbi:MAG: HlyD family efflux transporter periplasmic adaptor subunit [Cyclobacteriaceae bacterium]|nr:HlyD family efflux transporter periplasmic adaptor subunit [Cyclobacteriaceae bacterium]